MQKTKKQYKGGGKMDKKLLQELESSSGNMNMDNLKEWAANHQAELEKIISYLESIG